MRCFCCNNELSDFEATRRSASTGAFLDVCNGCYHYIKEDVCTIERVDLRHEDDENGEDSYENEC